jgi:AraC-like DNA-binding protein
MSRAVAAGPTSYATRFRLWPGRYWGIGLLPLGWARFVGARAGERADALHDVGSDAAFASFRPLAGSLFAHPADRAREAQAIDALMLALLERPAEEEERIEAIHAALVDPAVATVAALADRSGLPVRTLERIAKNVFGFAPKLLLRRQRFLRSLAQFMLDPSLAWLETMDDHYHDQAQFIRDFRRFMGMTPSAYAALPHPILGAAAHARNAAVGAAMQVLHAPGRGST